MLDAISHFMALVMEQLKEEPRWASVNFGKIKGLKDVMKHLAVSYMHDVRLKDRPQQPPRHRY